MSFLHLAFACASQCETTDLVCGDDAIADMFTSFFSTKSEGSGIGLAMVRQLVHRNGGAVRYARSIGGGARFIITF